MISKLITENGAYLRMNKYLVISKICALRSDIFNYIECELERRGIKGLVVSHGNILDILYDNDGRLTMKEISQGINRSKSTVTQLVDKLLLYGYVTKEPDPKDKRYSYIVLTEKGLNIKNDFKEISDSVINKFFINFTSEESETLIKLLDKACDNFTC